jgi:hypothetical protein
VDWLSVPASGERVLERATDLTLNLCFPEHERVHPGRRRGQVVRDLGVLSTCNRIESSLFARPSLPPLS